MKRFNWSFHHLPEVADLPRAQRMALLQACLPAIQRDPRWRLTMLLWLALIVSIFGLFFLLLPVGIGWALLIILPWGLISTVTLTQLGQWAMRPILAARRAAMTPQPEHDDGSYWVPPAR